MLTFIKGEGWVEEPPYATKEFTLECGTRVRLEAREPREDERFTCAWSTYWCLEPGVFNLDKLLPRRFTDYDAATLDKISGYREVGEKQGFKTGWVTLVPL